MLQAFQSSRGIVRKVKRHIKQNCKAPLVAMWLKSYLKLSTLLEDPSWMHAAACGHAKGGKYGLALAKSMFPISASNAPSISMRKLAADHRSLAK